MGNAAGAAAPMAGGACHAGWMFFVSICLGVWFVGIRKQRAMHRVTCYRLFACTHELRLPQCRNIFLLSKRQMTNVQHLSRVTFVDRVSTTCGSIFRRALAGALDLVFSRKTGMHKLAANTSYQ